MHSRAQIHPQKGLPSQYIDILHFYLHFGRETFFNSYRYLQQCIVMFYNFHPFSIQTISVEQNIHPLNLRFQLFFTIESSTLLCSYYQD